jgi:plastocyanin
MKRLTLATIPLVLLCVLVVAGCGSTPSSGSSSSGGNSSGSSGNTITMTSSNFTQHSITVQSSQPVVFDDPSATGGTHQLCVGTGNGGTSSCDTASQAPNAPSQLTGSGMTFNPGDKVSITFKPGSYHIICTIHPGMYIDVTAQ